MSRQDINSTSDTQLKCERTVSLVYFNSSIVLIAEVKRALCRCMMQTQEIKTGLKPGFNSFISNDPLVKLGTEKREQTNKIPKKIKQYFKKSHWTKMNRKIPGFFLMHGNHFSLY